MGGNFELEIIPEAKLYRVTYTCNDCKVPVVTLIDDIDVESAKRAGVHNIIMIHGDGLSDAPACSAQGGKTADDYTYLSCDELEYI